MEDGVWRTVGGRRIFIKNGEDLVTAMKNSGKFNHNDEYDRAHGVYKKEEDEIKERNKKLHREAIKKENEEKFEKFKKELESKNKETSDFNDDEVLFKEKNENILYENQNFTESQKQAIKEYTSENGYGSNETINRFLNGEKELGTEASKIVNQKIDTLESCITQPLNEDIYVYRGIKTRPKDLQVGQIIENKGFTSTSIYRSDASNFSYGSKEGSGTTIKIKASKGAKALYIGDKTSFHRNEHELLFGKGHSLKITKIEKLFDKDGDFMNYEIEGELL